MCMEKRVRYFILEKYYGLTFIPTRVYLYEKTKEFCEKEGIKAPSYKSVCNIINEAGAKMPKIAAKSIIYSKKISLSDFLSRFCIPEITEARTIIN